MKDQDEARKIIEDTGKNYNTIIFEEDFIPKDVYLYQIRIRDTFIRKLFSGSKFRYILDLGCGTGFHQATLGMYADILIGADMSFGALAECRKHFSGEYVVCDINHLPFKKNSLDCIWVAGVLHHIPADFKTAITDNIAVVLKSGGVVLIDEPNKWNPVNHVILKLSKADPTGTEKPLSLAQVKIVLENANMKIILMDWYELFAPFGQLLSNGNISRLSESVDCFLHRSFLKKIYFRWIIYAIKE